MLARQLWERKMRLSITFCFVIAVFLSPSSCRLLPPSLDPSEPQESWAPVLPDEISDQLSFDLNPINPAGLNESIPQPLNLGIWVVRKLTGRNLCSNPNCPGKTCCDPRTQNCGNGILGNCQERPTTTATTIFRTTLCTARTVSVTATIPVPTTITQDRITFVGGGSNPTTIYSDSVSVVVSSRHENAANPY